MRIDRLQLKGFSPAFPGVIDVPFRDLPEGVYAITGPNGAGKTSLLEASGPGLIFRQMPSSGGDPIDYATGRDSFIDEEFTIDGRGTFRARLNLDGPKRQSDAVLEQILSDGTRVPLNDGKRSTFDVAIRARFPSFDLFINSSFAAQGRGDEFSRRKPSQRKDLFVEFLALQHLAMKSQTAAAAAELCDDACLRLTAQLEGLERDTASPLTAALEQLAGELQTTGGGAELRQGDLRTTIADLETRLALLTDQVAANAAATQRVRQLETELALRRGDRAGVETQRQQAATTLADERARIAGKRDVDVNDAATRIAGNQQILAMKADIEAAVAGAQAADAELARLRADLSERHAEQQQAGMALRDVEKAIAALVPVDQRLTRATRDAGILGSVPCGGISPYDTCQFLKDATAAQAQLEALKAELAPKAALADRLATALRTVEQLAPAVTTLQGRITAADALLAGYAKQTKYAAPLAEATAKIAGYEAAQEKARADADQLTGEAQTRHDARLVDLETQITALDLQILTLTADVATARADLARTTEGNTEATARQFELTTARREWDTVTATLATVASGRAELDRRRQDLAEKRDRLVAVRGRLSRAQQELLEWKDLAKALGKGGLPDLEIDAAGPTISATTNALLLACAGPRYTVELVTQTAKADGSGMKDEFTVQVIDNEAGGDWRDISQFSGGQKTILQEALMLAITLYVNERSPMPIRTLWRDETGSALDPENAVRYIEMLRRVRELGGFWHVFFISHNPEASAKADAQIRVGDGHATIVYPPFMVAA